MDCRTALPLIHDAADDVPLSASDRAEIDRHVAECASCAKALRELVALRDALRAFPPVRAPDGFRDGVTARIADDAAIRGRILTWPRIVIPAAAAAALFVGAEVLSSVRSRMVDADAPAVASARRDKASPEALSADDALRAFEAKKKGAEDVGDEREKSDAASNSEPSESEAPEEPQAARKPFGGAPAPASSAPAAPASAPRPSGTPTQDAANEEPARIVAVFRSQEDADRFVASLAKIAGVEDAKRAAGPVAGGGSGPVRRTRDGGAASKDSSGVAGRRDGPADGTGGVPAKGGDGAPAAPSAGLPGGSPPAGAAPKSAPVPERGASAGADPTQSKLAAGAPAKVVGAVTVAEAWESVVAQCGGFVVRMGTDTPPVVRDGERLRGSAEVADRDPRVAKALEEWDVETRRLADAPDSGGAAAAGAGGGGGSGGGRGVESPGSGSARSAGMRTVRDTVVIVVLPPAAPAPAPTPR